MSRPPAGWRVEQGPNPAPLIAEVINCHRIFRWLSPGQREAILTTRPRGKVRGHPRVIDNLRKRGLVTDQNRLTPVGRLVRKWNQPLSGKDTWHMAHVKLSAKFTKADQPNNGFTQDELVGKVLREEGGEGYAIVRWHARHIGNDLDEGTRVPTFTFDNLEPVFDDDMAAAKVLLDKQYQARTGKRPDGAEQEPLFGVDANGERTIPEPSGEEILAEKREREADAAKGGEA